MTWMSGKVDPQRIVQESKFWPYYQMIYILTRICPERMKCNKILWDFEIRADRQIPTRRPNLVVIDKKKLDFAVSTDHKVKIKESETLDKYLDLAREWKKLRNMRVTVIPIVVGVLGTAPKGFEKGPEELEIKRRLVVVLITALSRSARILRKVLET